MPGPRGRAPTSIAMLQPSNADRASSVTSTSCSSGKAQSCSSSAAPSAARVRPAGSRAVAAAPAGRGQHPTGRDAEQERVADLSTRAGDGDGRGCARHAPSLFPPRGARPVCALRSAPRGIARGSVPLDAHDFQRQRERRRQHRAASWRRRRLAGGGVAGLGAIAVLAVPAVHGTDISGCSAAAACPTLRPGARSPTARPAPTRTRATNAGWPRHPSRSTSSGPEVQGYREPQLIIVDGQTATACGTASNATGPFYCPPEESVYVDPTFFALLREQFDATAGPLAQLYVLAHEYGHHIQQITGVMEQYPNNGTGADSNSVRTELQADCYAGAWVARPTEKGRERRPLPAGADDAADQRRPQRGARPSATTTSSRSPAAS